MGGEVAVAKSYYAGNVLPFRSLAAAASSASTIAGVRSGSALVFTNYSGSSCALGGHLDIPLPPDADLLIQFQWTPPQYLSFGHRFSETSILASEYGLWNSGYYADHMYTSAAVYIYRGTTALGSYSGQSGLAYTRLRLSGTTIQAKSWRVGDSEPGWLFSVSDSTYSSGVAALATRYATSVNFLGVGTDGDSPPTSGQMRVVSGVVTLGGTPVAGAQVTAVRYMQNMGNTLVHGVNYVVGTTNQNGEYSLVFNTDDPGPWIICATAVINGVHYASDARLITFS